jgi:hypothetical protein
MTNIKQPNGKKMDIFIVTQKTGLSLQIFPSICPYSLEQLLDKSWLPY